MPERTPAKNLLRALLGGALVAGIALVAASCVEAIGADGHRDAFAETCELSARCYSTTEFECVARFETGLQNNEARRKAFLERASDCVLGCGTVHRCLDLPGACVIPLGDCFVDADCCGFSGGTAACEEGNCCLGLGAECATNPNACCPSTGGCDIQGSGTCGGVACAEAGAKCLNDFQCCTGRCSNRAPPAGDPNAPPVGTCEEVACPPAGFPCSSDAECCDLLCQDGECTDPADCSLLGEGCNDLLPCCNPDHICFKPNGTDGICSPEECVPTNADCAGSGQCCSQFCEPNYHLCGKCQSAGSECSAALPCCDGLDCVGTTCQ